MAGQDGHVRVGGGEGGEALRGGEGVAQEVQATLLGQLPDGAVAGAVRGVVVRPGVQLDQAPAVVVAPGQLVPAGLRLVGVDGDVAPEALRVAGHRVRHQGVAQAEVRPDGGVRGDPGFLDAGGVHGAQHPFHVGRGDAEVVPGPDVGVGVHHRHPGQLGRPARRASRTVVCGPALMPPFMPGRSCPFLPHPGHQVAQIVPRDRSPGALAHVRPGHHQARPPGGEVGQAGAEEEALGARSAAPPPRSRGGPGRGTARRTAGGAGAGGGRGSARGGS